MDWFLHALKHSAILIPFLFVSYVLIELIENAFSKKINSKFFMGKAAPLVGAGFGIVPQCGFSVVATDLYSQKKISVGTLIAIFIATSDEAIPILLGNLNNANAALKLAALIGVKFVLAVAMGYLIDFVVKRFNKRKLPLQENINLLESATHHEHGHEHEEHDDSEHEESHDETIHKGCCGHSIEETKAHPAKQYLLHPLIHTLKVFAYILIVNIVFELILHYVGEQALADFLQSSYYFAPLIACLIGLIPNCASSVILTNLLVIGGLSFSACIAGLIVNAGIAYLVLFKQNKNIKVNFAILATMFAIGLASGYILMIFGL